MAVNAAGASGDTANIDILTKSDSSSSLGTATNTKGWRLEGVGDATAVTGNTLNYRYFDGTSWTTAMSSKTDGSLNMNSHKITGLPSGAATTSGDAVEFDQLAGVAGGISGYYVKKVGDTMTGPLVNNSNSASTAMAVTQSGAGYAATFMGGNVGIGTTTPGAPLDVLGKMQANPAVVDGAAAVAYSFDTTNALSNASAKLITMNNNGSLKSYFTSNGEFVLNTNNSALYIVRDASGNYFKSGGAARFSSVGIGVDPSNTNGIDINHAPSTGGVAYGVSSNMTNISTGGVGGFYTKRTVNNAGVTANTYGVYVDTLTVSAGSTTNNYGLYLDPGTTATNNYGVYQVGTAVKNYFAGNVGIGTTANTSLDLGTKTDAVRLPAGTTAQRPGTPVNGDIRYNSDNNKMEAYENGGWTNMIYSGTSGWALTGNTGTTAGTNFIGTTDNVDIVFKRNGVQSGLLNNSITATSWGVSALNTTSTGVANTAIGHTSLGANTSGWNNTAVGKSSMAINTTGGNNTALGTSSLSLSTGGSMLTAVGAFSLYNSTADGNSGFGSYSLYSMTTGGNNTAVGSGAAYNNVSGSNNSVTGYRALYRLTSGDENIAIGYYAGQKQADGTTNLTTANNSIYIGSNSRGFNNSDSNSIVIGDSAIGIGANSVVLGNNSITTTALKGNVGIGTTSPGTSLDLGTKTDAVRLPAGTTAQRPGTPVNGDIRYNSDNNKMEAYENGGWVNMVSTASGTVSGTTGKIAKFTGATAVGDSIITEASSALSIAANSASTGLAVVQSGAGYAATFTGGKVGIGTTTPGEALHVNSGNLKIQAGQAYVSPQTSAAASPLAFDTDAGNMMTWNTNTVSPTVDVNNMKAGASYMLIVRGTGTGSLTINCWSGVGTGAITSSFVPTNGPRTTNATIYNIITDGTYCYITWVSGFN